MGNFIELVASDGHELDCWIVRADSQNQAADSSETVNSNLESHSYVSFNSYGIHTSHAIS